MSDTKRRRLCGNCGRISQRDLDRNYCPFTARGIRPNKPADSCKFYVGEGGGDRRDRGGRRR